MPDKKKCIVFAVNAMMGGGAERVVLELVNRCKIDGYETVLLLSRREGPYLEQVAEHVKVLSVDVSLGFLDTFKFAKRLKRLLSGLDPLMIISHLTPMNRMLLRCRVLGAFRGPLTVVEHNSLMLQVSMREGLKSWLTRCELGLLYKRASYCIGVSQAVAQSIADATGLSRVECRVIYNPVDVTSIQAAAGATPSDAFESFFEHLPRPLILSAGRMHEVKDFPLLIEAFSLLPAGERGSLVILGEGQLLGSLKLKAEELEIQNDVHFPGFMKNPWWFMKRSDLFVLSSKWEGFGLVLAEAMACGVPVVSTNSAGPAEIIDDRVTGRLVPVGDVEALSNAMQQSLASRAEQEKYVANGLERAGAFIPEIALVEYLKLIPTIGNEVALTRADG